MPRYVTRDECAQRLHVHPRTVDNYIGHGYFPVYERPGERGWFVDLDEVGHAMRLLPARKAQGGKRFGPKARIVTLPAVAVVYTPEAGK